MPKGIPKDQTVKRKFLHRLKITKGHLEKVIRMVDAEEYCIDIIHQSMAVQAALKKLDQKILENHLKTCVAHSMRKGNEKEVLNEVMMVVKKI